MSATLSPQRSDAGDPSRAAGPAAISVANLYKTFKLPHEQYHTIKERALHPFRKRTYDLLHAVQDVSLEIRPGEFFGIVGRNGSGKSTLLKCLAGIYDVDSGSMRINGRVSPFLELGVGFNMDLPARDNVIINAVMLGLSRKEATLRFDKIIHFAELEEFVDLRLKNYSSGMYVRLAFATAVQVDAEILMIDEVLAVGDANFQQKCFDEFTRLQQAGKTILFVTHDMGAVERFCDRAMLLERGKVIEVSDPTTIARLYNQENFRRSRIEGQSAPELIPDAAPDARVRNAVFESSTGDPILTSNRGESVSVRMNVMFIVETVNPIFSITLLNESGHPAFATNTDIEHMTTGEFAAGSEATIRLRFDNWLAPGRYRLIASVARAGIGADIFDAHMSNSIIVLSDHAGGGLIDPPSTIEIEREPQPGAIPYAADGPGGYAADGLGDATAETPQ